MAGRQRLPASCSSGPAFEDDRAVGAAEPEGVGEGVIEAGFPGMVRDKVHVLGIRILVLEVDGGRQNLIAESKDGNAGLQTSRAAEQVPRHGFRGTHRNLAVAEEIADGMRF